MTTIYLVDSSAWVEYLRKTKSETNDFVRELIEREANLATTEPVAAELLSGVRNAAEQQVIERLTNGLIQLSLENRLDFTYSANLYREARSKGKTIRKLYDCLIAAVALRTDAVLVHCDRDFDHLAEVFPRLRVQRHNKD
ncbi:twitching motility protein PilT [Nocardiopsis sp. CNR-923]|uniref:type II toxin-antitoxin system VapC family toxin n=1 Tax=Nocardiopsis sp. CNR-923 TaxID=1904965 RepID=UPI00095B6806|nr:PIN domain nuclease [Nocardiopsis sp. CNR-923]OLT26083.1 twitching motility protein PilT [Nocardiopsis sp. CNR-923]